MITLTPDDVRTLATFKGDGYPVTSCYLDVDGSHLARYKDVASQLERLLRLGRTKANGQASVLEDLRLIEDFVKGGIDRSRTRGLAMFSSAKKGFWEVIELPVSVHNQIVVNQSPAIRQLEQILDDYEPFAVLLADRRHARMVVFELGEIAELRELFDGLPRGEDVMRGLDRGRVQDHVDELALQHLRHTAKVAFEVFQKRPFARLIIAASDDTSSELEQLLHPYLRERLEARCSLPIAASLEEIRTEALIVERAVERRKESESIDRLRQAVGSGNRGVAGLVNTLEALGQRRVETLYVSDAFEVQGWRCGSCNAVAAVGRNCAVCGAEMHQVDDVVEEAIQDALAQSCRVEICSENADLDILGGIGAMLRY